MSSILFYTSVRTRVKDQESLMVEFLKQGHTVYFLNQRINPYLPAICARAGVSYQYIETPTIRFTSLRIMFLVFHLVRFIRKNKINVVYSHLEPANFISVLAQFFVKSKVIIVRHHLDIAAHIGFDKDWSYRITYKLARQIICVSDSSKQYMVKQEGLNPDKIHHINLGYHYSVFGVPDRARASEIRSAYSDSIILITVGRLDRFKRPSVSLEICKKLNEQGFKTHLFLLGVDENNIVKQEIQDLGLESCVELLGFVDNVMDYLAAADWLVHPSISESSCVVVKEAALVELPIMVCKGVGDFDEYLLHRENALMLTKDQFSNEALDLIKEYSNSSDKRTIIGKRLKETVLPLFDIHSVVDKYNQFHW